jgi:hypothetical protein
MIHLHSKREGRREKEKEGEGEKKMDGRNHRIFSFSHPSISLDQPPSVLWRASSIAAIHLGLLAESSITGLVEKKKKLKPHVLPLLLSSTLLAPATENGQSIESPQVSISSSKCPSTLIFNSLQ